MSTPRAVPAIRRSVAVCLAAVAIGAGLALAEPAFAGGSNAPAGPLSAPSAGVNAQVVALASTKPKASPSKTPAPTVAQRQLTITGPGISGHITLNAAKQATLYSNVLSQVSFMDTQPPNNSAPPKHPGPGYRISTYIKGKVDKTYEIYPNCPGGPQGSRATATGTAWYFVPYTVTSILQSAGVPVSTGQVQDSSEPSVAPTKTLAANKHENVANLIGNSRLLLGLAGAAAFIVMILLALAARLSRRLEHRKIAPAAVTRLADIRATHDGVPKQRGVRRGIPPAGRGGSVQSGQPPIKAGRAAVPGVRPPSSAPASTPAATPASAPAAGPLPTGFPVHARPTVTMPGATAGPTHGALVPNGPASGAPSSPSGAPFAGAPFAGPPPFGAPSSGAPASGAPASGAPASGAPAAGAHSSGAPAAPSWWPAAGASGIVADAAGSAGSNPGGAPPAAPGAAAPTSSGSSFDAGNPASAGAASVDAASASRPPNATGAPTSFSGRAATPDVAHSPGPDDPAAETPGAPISGTPMPGASVSGGPIARGRASAPMSALAASGAAPAVNLPSGDVEPPPAAPWVATGTAKVQPSDRPSVPQSAQSRTDSVAEPEATTFFTIPSSRRPAEPTAGSGSVLADTPPAATSTTPSTSSAAAPAPSELAVDAPDDENDSAPAVDDRSGDAGTSPADTSSAADAVAAGTATADTGSAADPAGADVTTVDPGSTADITAADDSSAANTAIADTGTAADAAAADSGTAGTGTTADTRAAAEADAADSVTADTDTDTDTAAAAAATDSLTTDTDTDTATADSLTADTSTAFEAATADSLTADTSSEPAAAATDNLTADTSTATDANSAAGAAGSDTAEDSDSDEGDHRNFFTVPPKSTIAPDDRTEPLAVSTEDMNDRTERIDERTQRIDDQNTTRTADETDSDETVALGPDTATNSAETDPKRANGTETDGGRKSTVPASRKPSGATTRRTKSRTRRPKAETTQVPNQTGPADADDASKSATGDNEGATARMSAGRTRKTPSSAPTTEAD